MMQCATLLVLRLILSSKARLTRLDELSLCRPVLRILRENAEALVSRVLPLPSLLSVGARFRSLLYSALEGVQSVCAYYFSSHTIKFVSAYIGRRGPSTDEPRRAQIERRNVAAK